MTRAHQPSLLALLGAVVAACAAPQPTIRYVAFEMPPQIDVRPTTGEHNVGRVRMGLLYRPPPDVEGQLRELQKKAGSGVLINVQSTFRTPFCYVVFCFGQDFIDAAKTEPLEIPFGLAKPSAPPAEPPAPDLSEVVPARVEPGVQPTVALPPAEPVASAAPSEPAPAPEPGTGRVENEGRIVDRPVAGANVVLSLERGATVALVRKMRNAAGDWWYVRINGRSGWMKAEELVTAE